MRQERKREGGPGPTISVTSVLDDAQQGRPRGGAGSSTQGFSQLPRAGPGMWPQEGESRFWLCLGLGAGSLSFEGRSRRGGKMCVSPESHSGRQSACTPHWLQAPVALGTRAEAQDGTLRGQWAVLVPAVSIAHQAQGRPPRCGPCVSTC